MFPVSLSPLFMAIPGEQWVTLVQQLVPICKCFMVVQNSVGPTLVTSFPEVSERVMRPDRDVRRVVMTTICLVH